jgi:sigma-B regulation protein RsbU (phosphoserine phosphatase)
MYISTKRLVCREIWGGNEKADQLIEFGGFRGRLLSRPYESSSGGDIHFLSLCDRERLTKIVIADVAGHGELVSDVALELKNLLRQNLNEMDNSKLLVSLNDSLSHRLKEGKFVTMVAATFHGTDGSFIYAYAGAPTILRYDAAKSDWQPLRPTEHGASGAPLGVIDNTEYIQAMAKIFSGDMLLFYTDGLLDMKTRDNGHTSAGNLIDLCREVTPPRPDPDTVLTALIERIEQTGGFGDDVTSLIIQLK